MRKSPYIKKQSKEWIKEMGPEAIEIMSAQYYHGQFLLKIFKGRKVTKKLLNHLQGLIRLHFRL